MLYQQPYDDLVSGVTRRVRKPLRDSQRDIRWRKSGLGYQLILGDNIEGCRTGYVKIWDRRSGERVVIDRALTIKRASAIIKGLEAKGPLFNATSVLDDR